MNIQTLMYRLYFNLISIVGIVKPYTIIIRKVIMISVEVAISFGSI